jgi:hypothetical protein
MTSLLLAAAVTGMLSGAEARASGALESAGSANAEPLGDKHDCRGKNDCKGKGGCKTDKHECKGKNDCKGQGGCSSKMSGTVPRLHDF